MKVKMLKLLSPLFVLALALSLMAAVALPQTASASPADWYVSTMGSDTEGDGSSGNPWRTIQHAVYSPGVSDGDTIIVHEGTYTENVNVDKELTIRAATGENVTVQALDSNDHVFEVTTADHVTISGFAVTNATGSGRAGIYLGYGVEHCSITNNTVSGNYYGIHLDFCTGNTIEGNTASGNAEYGIYLDDSSNNTIGGNTASDSLRGIFLYYSSGNTISSNTLSGNSPEGILLYASNGNTVSNNTASGNECGIFLEYSSENTVSGNTASGNDQGIRLMYSSDNNTISDNTASDNAEYGIHLHDSSNNTIEGNTALSNSDGIHLDQSTGNTICSNTAWGNDRWAIYLWGSSDNNTVTGNDVRDNTGSYYSAGICADHSHNNTIDNNTANSNSRGIYIWNSSASITNNVVESNQWGIFFGYFADSNEVFNNLVENNDYGIYVANSSNNTITSNHVNSNNAYGIYLEDWVSDTLISNNEITGNPHGLWIEGDNNRIIGNNIQNNTGSEDSGIHFTADASGNVAHFNNIVDNSPDGSGSYGIYNENTTEIVGATLNWWGAASGPSGVGPGTGDAVSDYVDFEPWLGASVVGVIAEDITGAQTDVVISGPAGSDTTLTVNTSDDVTVIVALYSGNPEEPLPDKALGKYIDIYASDPDAIDWPVYVEMSYTEDEVAAAGIDETTLGLYYWDASANEFHRCSDTGVDTATNVIWANVSEDEAGGLAGTPFAPGGAAAPAGLSIGVIVGIVIGACAAAGLIAYFVIRRRRAAG